jgi:hypothetical protein
MSPKNQAMQSIKKTDSETLKNELGLIKQYLPFMPHHQLPYSNMRQKSIDCDLLRWYIQRELDSRKAGEIAYSWEEMYFSVGIPKKFLAI